MKTCSEFLNEMRDAGFDFKFVATSGDVVIKGECKLNEEGKLTIKAKRQLTDEQLKERIKNRAQL